MFLPVKVFFVTSVAEKAHEIAPQPFNNVASEDREFGVGEVGGSFIVVRDCESEIG